MKISKSLSRFAVILVAGVLAAGPISGCASKKNRAPRRKFLRAPLRCRRICKRFSHYQQNKIQAGDGGRCQRSPYQGGYGQEWRSGAERDREKQGRSG